MNVLLLSPVFEILLDGVLVIGGGIVLTVIVTALLVVLVRGVAARYRRHRLVRDQLATEMRIQRLTLAAANEMTNLARREWLQQSIDRTRRGHTTGGGFGADRG